MSSEKFALLKIESLVLEQDESVYRKLWRVAFPSLAPPENLTNNDIFEVAIHARGCIFSSCFLRYLFVSLEKKIDSTDNYGKYKHLTSLESKKDLADIQNTYQAELEIFKYHYDG